VSALNALFEDPRVCRTELTWVRSEKQYDQRVYYNPCVQNRLCGMVARQELVREWAWRGVTDSEQYRQLTNLIMEQTFGMDGEPARSHDRPGADADDARGDGGGDAPPRSQLSRF